AEAHPETELSLVVGNYEDVVERVRTHRDDIAFSGRPPEDERLVAEPVMDNEIVCITAADDPLAQGGPVATAALAERAWLLRERGSGTRALNERFLADRGLAPRTLMLGSNGAIKQAARAGVGVSLLSRAAVEAELKSSLLGEIALSDGPEVRPWFLLRSAVGPARPAVEAFAAFVTARRQGPRPRSPRGR
ncbi:MAG TPA: LysR substrate-binding domain-containing protein, partial [Solirubrobacterales bacterium]|nr:LysR substrate-binding domain-containing protein [Solirubrobacterales bacterium]